MKNITLNKSLSGVDARLLTTLSERGHDIFTTKMAAEILGQTSLAVRKRLHYLVRRRWLQRLEKGRYLIVPLSAGMAGHHTENELVIASHLVSPSYVSYWTALSYYGYTDQPSRTIYIATTRQKRPVIIHGLTYILTWILTELSRHPSLGAAALLKGGTALKKLYYREWRYSEDLDFTF